MQQCFGEDAKFTTFCFVLQPPKATWFMSKPLWTIFLQSWALPETCQLDVMGCQPLCQPPRQVCCRGWQHTIPQTQISVLRSGPGMVCCQPLLLACPVTPRHRHVKMQDAECDYTHPSILCQPSTPVQVSMLRHSKLQQVVPGP